MKIGNANSPPYKQNNTTSATEEKKNYVGEDLTPQK